MKILKTSTGKLVKKENKLIIASATTGSKTDTPGTIPDISTDIHYEPIEDLLD